MQSVTQILPLTADQPTEAGGSLGVAAVPLACDDDRRQKGNEQVADWFVPIAEVAKRLGTHTRTVHRMIAAGQFPRPVKVGRTSQWRVADIERHKANLRLTQKTKEGNGGTSDAADTDSDHSRGNGSSPIDEHPTKGPRLLLEKKLTVTQAAKAMGLSASSLRRIIIEGRLPVLKMQRKVLILESDAEAFLQECRVTVKQIQGPNNRLPSLPQCVAESEHLR